MREAANTLRWVRAVWLVPLSLGFLLGWVAGCGTPQVKPVSGRDARVSFTSFTKFEKFRPDPTNAACDVWVSEEIPVQWDELVLSWNASAPAGSSLSFDARALYPEGPTQFYQLGTWSEEDGARWSVDGQNDAFGKVSTDTLVLRQSAPAVQVRVRRETRPGGPRPELRFLGLSLLENATTEKRRPAPAKSLERVLDVPQRSQLDYEGGRGWCSPTSVSMVMAWWANSLGDPTLEQEVPTVAQGVYDPVWKGTGNWSFNAAFAGRFPQLRGCVARLPDVTELERWIAREVPPICSVDARKLRGPGIEEGEVGHLVVVVGFTANGDVVLNDPWAKPGDSVRKTVPREYFVRAWEHSRNTAYLIYPSRLGYLPLAEKGPANF